MLLGLLAVGLYLAYQSILASVRAVPSQLEGAAGNAASTGLNTLLAEGKSMSSSLLSPVLGLSSLGTQAYNGISSFFSAGQSTTVTPSGLTDLSGITSPSLLLPDGSNYSLPVVNAGWPESLSDGGTLDIGGLLKTTPNLSGTDSFGNYGSLTDSSPGDGFLPSNDDWSDLYDWSGGL